MEILEFKPRGLTIYKDEKLYLISEGFSWCNKCESVKKFEEFSKDKSNYYGIDPSCKECRKNLAAQRRLDHPERVREIRRNSRNKHAEKSRLSHRKWVSLNKEATNKYRRNKYANDVDYKLGLVCRAMVRRMFKSTEIKKCYKTEEVLGYTPQQLKQHIELQFKEGMTWENYGEWHVDHKIPISYATSLFEGIRLSQLENLQPLWAQDNLVKSNKII